MPKKARRDEEAREDYEAGLETAGNDERKKKTLEETYQKALRESKERHKHELEVCEKSPG